MRARCAFRVRQLARTGLRCVSCVSCTRTNSSATHQPATPCGSSSCRARIACRRSTTRRIACMRGTARHTTRRRRAPCRCRRARRTLLKKRELLKNVKCPGTVCLHLLGACARLSVRLTRDDERASPAPPLFFVGEVEESFLHRPFGHQPHDFHGSARAQSVPCVYGAPQQPRYTQRVLVLLSRYDVRECVHKRPIHENWPR